jgi:hypothetical protein
MVYYIWELKLKEAIEMANEIVAKQLTEDCVIHTISYQIEQGCAIAPGKQLTGGKPGVNNGQKVVMFAETHKGQKLGLRYDTRPELAALVAEYEALEASKQAEREIKWAAQKAADEAIRKPLIEAMQADLARLVSQIPVDRIRVAVTEDGDLDGWKLYKYTVDGFVVESSEVNVIGWASATYPGAMAPFVSECIASISRQRLIELKQEKDAADRQKAETEAAETAKSEAELAAKFAEAKQTSKKIFIRSWMADCNDPQEECSTDVVSEWAMPDGTTQISRQHTW